MSSLKSVLERKTKDAAEAEALSLNRQRLQQLIATEGQAIFKFAAERNSLQKELE